jgi:hypothetical protein
VIKLLLQLPIGAESVDFCGKSHVTHFSQGSVDKPSTSELGKEHLESVVLKALGIIEVGEWLGIGVKVAAVDRAVHPIAPFYLWVCGCEVISYPPTFLCSMFVLIEYTRCICAVLHPSSCLHHFFVDAILGRVIPVQRSDCSPCQWHAVLLQNDACTLACSFSVSHHLVFFLEFLYPFLTEVGSVDCWGPFVHWVLAVGVFFQVPFPCFEGSEERRYVE